MREGASAVSKAMGGFPQYCIKLAIPLTYTLLKSRVYIVTVFPKKVVTLIDYFPTNDIK
jgi:hypothetical protein